MRIKYVLILLTLCLTMPQVAIAQKKKEVAIQLYSVRDLINKGGDLNQILRIWRIWVTLVWKLPTTMMASFMERRLGSLSRW